MEVGLVIGTIQADDEVKRMALSGSCMWMLDLLMVWWLRLA